MKTPEKGAIADSGDQDLEEDVQMEGEEDEEDESSKQLMQMKKRGFRFNRYNRRTQKKKGKKKKKRNAQTKGRNASTEILVGQEEARNAQNEKTQPPKKADDLYPVVKQS